MAVNSENVNELADFLEKEKFKFDMSDFRVKPQCGSAGCIGGHAAALWYDVRQVGGSELRFTFDDDKLAEKLGISDDKLNDLCYPGDYENKPREKAVETLRRLARTGKVLWK